MNKIILQIHTEQMESQKSSSSTSRGSFAGRLSEIYRLHHYLQLPNQTSRWYQQLRGRSLLPKTNFHPPPRAQLRFSIRISCSEKERLSWKYRITLRMHLFRGSEGVLMLNNATEFRKIYVAAGYTDLRRRIDGLVSIVKFNFQSEPHEKDNIFLFCGRRSDRMKGLVWEGDRFLLLNKSLELGGFSWAHAR